MKRFFIALIVSAFAFSVSLAEEVIFTRQLRPQEGGEDSDYRITASIENNILYISTLRDFILQVNINGRMLTFNYEQNAEIDVAGFPPGAEIILLTDSAIYTGHL